MKKCIFCYPEIDKDITVVFKNDYCMFLQMPQEVLIGSGIIVPIKHRETAFDLTEEEWNSSYELLQEVKKYLDVKHNPEGYNVGWNVGEIGGQTVFHAHMHVIPRYKEEPLAGKGIRYWIKQLDNKHTKK